MLGEGRAPYGGGAPGGSLMVNLSIALVGLGAGKKGVLLLYCSFLKCAKIRRDIFVYEIGLWRLINILQR